MKYLILLLGFWLHSPCILLFHSASPDPEGHSSTDCWLHREKIKQNHQTHSGYTGLNKHTGSFPRPWDYQGFAHQFYSISVTSAESHRYCHLHRFHLGSKSQHPLLWDPSEFSGVSNISPHLGVILGSYVGLGPGDSF